MYINMVFAYTQLCSSIQKPEKEYDWYQILLFSIVSFVNDKF